MANDNESQLCKKDQDEVVGKYLSNRLCCHDGSEKEERRSNPNFDDGPFPGIFIQPKIEQKRVRQPT